MAKHTMTMSINGFDLKVRITPELAWLMDYLRNKELNN